MVASRYGWDHVQILIAIHMHKDIVLLTSASGYIGGRLLRALEKGGRSAVHATAVLLLCAGALIPETGHAQPNTPVRTVPSVDLERYVGEWFEIGRFPNRFQRRCVGDVTARYARRSDGTLDVINRCRTDGESIAARGVARVVDDTGARLKVRFAPAALSFLPFVWGDYWILGLAGDYSWAVVGSPDRDYLWVLARTPTLGEDAFGQAMAVARANGFNVDRLERTAQGAAQGGLDVSGTMTLPQSIGSLPVWPQSSVRSSCSRTRSCPRSCRWVTTGTAIARASHRNI